MGVSVYVELQELDTLDDEKLSVEFDAEKPRAVGFTANFPSGARTLSLNNLSNDVASVSLDRKKGQNKVVLKLIKKDDPPTTWYSLLDGQGGGGGGDSDAEDGGMGGMGGMDPAMMQQMMGGMGGMMGGMGM